MKFSVALHGSFKDSAGYTWRVPTGLDASILEKIVSKLERQYSDGRQLHSRALYGGYYIDAPYNRFYAFRFLDGGRDNLGRAGVVITNWAIGSYSEVIGKDIAALFDRMTFMQLPENGNMDIVLLPANAENSIFSFGETEKELTGEEARCVFQLPREKSNGSLLVEFCIDEKSQWCKVQFLMNGKKSMQPEKTPLKKPCVPPQNKKEKEPHKIPSSFRLPVAHIVAICAVCAVSIALMLLPKTEKHLPPVQQSSGYPVEIVKAPSKPEKPISVPPKVNPQNLHLVAKEFILLLPGGTWGDKDGSFVRKMKLTYQWGYLEINNSQFTWCFNDNISFKKVKGANECQVLSSGDIIGRIEWYEAVKLFAFSRSYGLPGNKTVEKKLFLYHEELNKVSAELTLCSTSVSLKLYPEGNDAVPPKAGTGWQLFSGKFEKE